MANSRPGGQRLREIRTHRGLSQALLASMISVSTGTIQNYERGRAPLTAERIDQLARALNVEPADLVALPGSPLPKYRYAPRLPQPERLNLWPVRIGFYSRAANVRDAIVEVDRVTLAACGLAANAPGSMALYDWWNRLHSDDHSLVKSEYARLDRVGVFAAQYRLRGWDGVERSIVDCSRMGCDERGRPLRLSGMVIDVTQMRRTKTLEFNIALLIKIMQQT